jgi:ATP-dependent RNA helicase DHR2
MTPESKLANSPVSHLPTHDKKRKWTRDRGHNLHVNNGQEANSQTNRDLSTGSRPPSMIKIKLSDRRDLLLRARQSLPIWPHAKEIQQALQGQKDVLLLVGETGSGKSTQVPQFLLNEPWCTRCIAITQPRRVAAISLAKRVAEEVGTPLGSSSPASKVGYSVRFDTSVSPSTRIKFLTEGMLLQEMMRDSLLRQYSAIIVDEVHERSVNVDVLLGFLRNLLIERRTNNAEEPLKLVVMSATAEMERLKAFLQAGCNKSKESLSMDGYESDSTWSGFSTSSDEQINEKREDPYNVTSSSGANTVTQDMSNNATSAEGAITFLQNDNKTVHHRNLLSAETVEAKKNSVHHHDTQLSISSCHIQGRQYPVQIMYLPEPAPDWVEAALKAILQIHAKEPLPGDILVFMTGQDAIESLESLVTECAHALSSDLPKVRAFSM